MDEGLIKLIGVASITGLGLLSILWLRLRWLMYRDVEPEISTMGQIIAHFFQAGTLFSFAFLYGEPPLLDIPSLKTIAPFFYFGYLATFLIAYILKSQQYRRIIKAREDYYTSLRNGEGETLD